MDYYWHDDVFYDKINWNYGMGQYLGADDEEDEEDDEEDEEE